MTDIDDAYNLIIGSESDNTSAEKTGENIGKNVKKGIKKVLGNDGYIKLAAEITDYKYPKQTTMSSGIVAGKNYSKLQKAQDELISNWNKLSKKGFFSDDEAVLSMLRSYRNYRNTTKSEYGSWEKAYNDPQFRKIENIIGAQISKYFTRLVGSVDIGSGRKGPFIGVETAKSFDNYAKQAISLYKAAKELNIDLSKDGVISSEDKTAILKKADRMRQMELIAKKQEQARYEQEHAQEIKQEQDARLNALQEERKKYADMSINIPKYNTEEVKLNSTEVKNLAEPKEDLRTKTERYNDSQTDKRFIKGFQREALARSFNTPTKDINLGLRHQIWSGTYITDPKDFFGKLERSGTFIDTNALLRQTQQALPEEIKKSIASLVTRIDKDEVAQKFNVFDESDQKQFQELSNQLGLSRQLLVNVAKVQGGLMAGREDTSADDLKNAILVALTDAVEHGKSQILAENFNTAVQKIVNMLMTRYSNMKDRIGSNVGRIKGDGTGERITENQRGVGVNYETVKQTLKEVFDQFQKTAEILLDRAIKEFPSFYGETRTRKEKTTTFDKEYLAKLNTSYDTLKNYLGDAAQGLATLLNITKLNDAAVVVSNRKQEKILTDDANSGANTDESTNQLISEQSSTENITKTIQNILENLYNVFGSCPCEEVLQAILQEIQNISQGKKSSKGKDDLNTGLNEKTLKSLQAILHPVTQLLLPAGQSPLLLPPARGDVPRSNVMTSLKDPAKWTIRMKDAIADFLGVTAQYKKTVAATSEEQDALSAKLISNYGLGRGRDITGDKILAARSMSLWRNTDAFEKYFKDLKITDGINIDTTEVTDKIGKVLSGPAMRNAQMGGSVTRNLLGYGMAFIGMPSLEKSRAAADAFNQIAANIREKMNTTVSDILEKESILVGMRDRGELQLDTEGNVLKESTPEAKALAAQLESSKIILDSILADVKNVNEAIDKSPNNILKILRLISFTSPALRENNAIINNINAGYNKSGKALKFQSRTAEILNYTFQLMSRHIGQIFKSMALMLNPFNLIKKAFDDFMSYDVKWKRTMNVIKYNIRAIVRPFMEWLAQSIVNILGVIDRISMKIQQAFGRIPISLFDQMAAQAEKTREEIQNVTVSFDELHDIGSDNTKENDLLGDIYKPQLSKEWQDFADWLGDIFSGISLAIKGCIDNWQIFVGLLATFKIAQGLLKLHDFFSKLGGAINTTTGSFGTFGQGFKLAFQHLFDGGEYSLLGELGFMLTNPKAITEAKSWGMMIGETVGTALIAAISITLGTALLTDAINTGLDVGAYNFGVDSMGGKASDKKSLNIGDKLKGALGGAGIGFGISKVLWFINPIVGATIGATVGLIQTALSPAVADLEARAREANNEMQKISVYQAQLKVVSTQVDEYDEQLKLLNQTLDIQTTKVREQGEKLGISKTRMDELVEATQDGTYNTDMLSSSERGLADDLDQLMWAQKNVTETTKKLTEAKKKQQRVELDIALMDDIEAKRFELAEARIEVALASGLYSGEEAAKAFTRVMKQASDEQKLAMLQDISPDLQENLKTYTESTQDGMHEMVKLCKTSSEDVKNALYGMFDKSVQQQIDTELTNLERVVKSHTGFWENVGGFFQEVFTGGAAVTWFDNPVERYRLENKGVSDWNSKKIQVATDFLNRTKSDPTLSEEEKKRRINELYTRLAATFDVGTNYVPSDGLAYLHQGEAVIPKKYNQPFVMDNSNLEDAVYNLTRQVEQINNKVNQGIDIRGQFVQRGSDLVATVEKANNRLSNNILNNKVFAR